MSRFKFFLLAVLIVAVVSLLPGIRGYHNWAFHEIAMVYFVTGSYLTWLYDHRVGRAPTSPAESG